MKVRTYEKLVRRYTPEIIKANGSTPNIKEYYKDSDILIEKFKEKIKEETEELLESKSSDEIIEEAADVIQVIIDYLGIKGFTLEDLETVRHAKVIKRGTFFDYDTQTATYLVDVIDN